MCRWQTTHGRDTMATFRCYFSKSDLKFWHSSMTEKRERILVTMSVNRRQTDANLTADLLRIQTRNHLLKRKGSSHRNKDAVRAWEFFFASPMGYSVNFYVPSVYSNYQLRESGKKCLPFVGATQHLVAEQSTSLPSVTAPPSFLCSPWSESLCRRHGRQSHLQPGTVAKILKRERPMERKYTCQWINVVRYHYQIIDPIQRTIFHKT